MTAVHPVCEYLAARRQRQPPSVPAETEVSISDKWTFSTPEAGSRALSPSHYNRERGHAVILAIARSFEPEFYFRSINLEARGMLLIRINEVPVADSVSRLPSPTGQKQFPLRNHAAISCGVDV